MLTMMRNKFWMLTIGLFVVSALVSFSHKGPRNLGEVHEAYIGIGDEDQQDWNQCVQKATSEWGGGCLNYGFSEEKYTVHLVNSCTEVVDLMSCVQRTNNQWSCFYRLDMKQSDTLHAYACRGNGKFLKWVRKAGDITTKFPSRKEVNDQY